MSPRRIDVLLYVPNLIGYARILCALTILGAHARVGPAGVAALYVGASLLDMADGILARALGQTSRFGEVLDVVADNICRTAMWVLAAATSPAWLLPGAVVLGLEWTTFAAAHAGSVASARHWKAPSLEQPRLLQMILHNGFKNPLGACVILSIFGLPLAAFLATAAVPGSMLHTVGAMSYLPLAVGRAVGASVECWVIANHAGLLLGEDVDG